MKNLISMTDFVLEQKKLKIMRLAKLYRIENYANFLKQPLELEMFVPCDEDVNVLKEPEWWHRYCNGASPFMNWDEIRPCQEYKQAKERCLFEGFEIVDRGNFYFLERGDTCIFYRVLKNNKKVTIEDLLKFPKVQLTTVAQNITV